MGKMTGYVNEKLGLIPAQLEYGQEYKRALLRFKLQVQQHETIWIK